MLERLSSDRRKDTSKHLVCEASLRSDSLASRWRPTPAPHRRPSRPGGPPRLAARTGCGEGIVPMSSPHPFRPRAPVRRCCQGPGEARCRLLCDRLGWPAHDEQLRGTGLGWAGGFPQGAPRQGAPRHVRPAKDGPPRTRDLRRDLQRDPGKDIRDERSAAGLLGWRPFVHARAIPWRNLRSRCAVGITGERSGERRLGGLPPRLRRSPLCRRIRCLEAEKGGLAGIRRDGSAWPMPASGRRAPRPGSAGSGDSLRE